MYVTSFYSIFLSVDFIKYKFSWNKKWDGKCPDRIQSRVLKNSYEMGGLKAPDMAALNSALKVKQFINATKSKIKINKLQRLFTTRSAQKHDLSKVWLGSDFLVLGSL